MTASHPGSSGTSHRWLLKRIFCVVGRGIIVGRKKSIHNTDEFILTKRKATYGYFIGVSFFFLSSVKKPRQIFICQLIQFTYTLNSLSVNQNDVIDSFFVRTSMKHSLFYLGDQYYSRTFNSNANKNNEFCIFVNLL